jgi:hypothetical protein
MFPLCDLQGYVDLISLARCFASRRSDLGLFLFVLVGNFLFSMLRNPSIPWVHLVRDAYYHQAVPHAVVLAGSFRWKSIIILSHEYGNITRCSIGNGSSVFFGRTSGQIICWTPLSQGFFHMLKTSYS